jgi:hypothetical protein
MSEAVTPEVKSNRMKEFMSLLPLTVEIAGLPRATPERLFNSDQMEGRILAIRTAYRLARAMVKDIGDNGVPG